MTEDLAGNPETRSDEAVERVAEALHDLEYPAWSATAVEDSNRWSWRGDGHLGENGETDHYDSYRAAARAVLTAEPLLDRALRAEAASERQADLIAEFRKRDESATRVIGSFSAVRDERDAALADLATERERLNAAHQVRENFRAANERLREANGAARLAYAQQVADALGERDEALAKIAAIREAHAEMHPGCALSPCRIRQALAAPTWEPRVCESGCGCRYGTTDPDRHDCACDGPCCIADPAEWGCNPELGGCGGDCPTCPSRIGAVPTPEATDKERA